MVRDVTLRLGARASPLARWQAEYVAAQLQSAGVTVQLIPITTQGDAHQTRPVGSIGTTGVFTKQIQQSLLAGQIDLAVHSLKDLPTEPAPGLVLAAVPERHSVRDALVSRHGESLAQLSHGAVVGTGSLRRQSQLLHVRPDLAVQDIRGNVETRLEKLDQGSCHAVVLAEAGLARLGLAGRITEVLSIAVCLPAVGQGALGIEARADDPSTRNALADLDHLPTRQAVTAERTMLRILQGGCLAPVGAWARIERDQLILSAAVLSPDGRHRIEHIGNADPADASQLGESVARSLIDQGASDLIQASRAAE